MNELSFYKPPKHIGLKDPERLLRLPPHPNKMPFYDLTTTPNNYQEYKGLWYKYIPDHNTWKISTDPNENGWLWVFDGDTYRIDQCFDKVWNDEDFNTWKNGQTL